MHLQAALCRCLLSTWMRRSSSRSGCSCRRATRWAGLTTQPRSGLEVRSLPPPAWIQVAHVCQHGCLQGPSLHAQEMQSRLLQRSWPPPLVVALQMGARSTSSVLRRPWRRRHTSLAACAPSASSSGVALWVVGRLLRVQSLPRLPLAVLPSLVANCMHSPLALMSCSFCDRTPPRLPRCLPHCCSQLAQEALPRPALGQAVANPFNSGWENPLFGSTPALSAQS